MTGKRQRALTRTASVSQLSSGALSQEFSPLLENPKEKLKPTAIGAREQAFCAPRVVIGFEPKPATCDRALCTKSAPSSPCYYQEKAASPRSGLNSLLSRQQWGAGAGTVNGNSGSKKSSEGVGLGIVLHGTGTTTTTAPTPTPDDVVSAVEDVKISILERENHHHYQQRGDHTIVPVREDIITTSPQRSRFTINQQTPPPRRHSHPIPILAAGSSYVQPCSDDFVEVLQPAQDSQLPQQPVAVRPPIGWMEREDLVVDRRDTFLLAPSPVRSSHMGENYRSNNVALQTALTAAVHFLDECSFCKRHLAEGKDIFMYRYWLSSYRHGFLRCYDEDTKESLKVRFTYVMMW